MKKEEEKTLKGRRKRAERKEGREREERKRNFLPLLLLYNIIYIYVVCYF